MMGSLPEISCPVESLEPKVMPMSMIVNQLGKHRLSGFVTATAVVGYIMSGGTSPLIIGALTAGTYLQSLSANTANQTIEVEYDRLMKRTCKRPLVTGQITRPQAALLSAAELGTGTAILYAVSPIAAGLGVLNWGLYVGVYTPLKRISATNTWWGSIVGGIPPLMGGAAATCAIAGPAMAQAYLLGALMLAWQIPHFMALSFHCRRDYEAGGFKMLAFSNPWRASFYAVAVSVLLAVICLAGPMMIDDMAVELYYWPIAAAANGLMIWKSIMFHNDPVRYCRSCFVFSYMYLGVMLLLFSVNHFQPVKLLTDLAEAFGAGGVAGVGEFASTKVRNSLGLQGGAPASAAAAKATI